MISRQLLLDIPKQAPASQTRTLNPETNLLNSGSTHYEASETYVDDQDIKFQSYPDVAEPSHGIDRLCLAAIRSGPYHRTNLRCCHRYCHWQCRKCQLHVQHHYPPQTIEGPYIHHGGSNSSKSDDKWASSSSSSLACGVCDLCKAIERREYHKKVWLGKQMHSGSRIARMAARNGIVVGMNVQTWLIHLEKDIAEKLQQKRAARLRQQRQERSILVDTEDQLRNVLDRMAQLDHSDAINPKVVIDCEGLSFEHTGTIDIMELFIRPDDTLYFIDIIALKDRAWSVTSTDNSFSLAKFLSSSSDKKVMWDSRMDAHILKKLYGIRLSGVLDGSLWSIAYRRRYESPNETLRLSIEGACRMHLSSRIEPCELESMETAKSNRYRLPGRVWAIRPLPSVLIDYAADVKYMCVLYERYRKRLGRHAEIVREVDSLTEQDLEIACDPFWTARRERGAGSPWTRGYIEDAKEDNKKRMKSALEIA